MHKRLFVGVDEAGYGPNLGPLLICGSAWLAPASFTEATLVAAFSQAFKAEPWRPDCKHVPLGDSKKLYRPAGGLLALEAGLLALLSQLHPGLLSLQALLDATGAMTSDFEPALPWYELDAISDLPVPVSPHLNAQPPPMATEHDQAPRLITEVQRLSQLAQAALAEHDIELIDMRAILVTEPVFNSRVAELGSKGQLLSQVTMRLVAGLLAKHAGYPAEVFCDRQGGRKNYMPVLFDAMPDAWFTETLSSNARCSYCTHALAPVEIHFSVGGDAFPPTALASMLAKYLRERLMQAFNQYWQQQVPRLKPTAGYPRDAKRFRAAIEPVAEKLSFSPERWWRCR